MKVNKNPSAKEIRQFILLWALFASIAGGLLLWRHHPQAAHGAWIAAVLVGVLGVLILPFGRLVYRLWMGFAAGMNFIVTRLLLAFIFFVILTPLALFFRLTGRDALRRKKSSFSKDSYWLDHDSITDVSSYKHLY
jgi:multisubunit Na+/H+ antiporter MnhG subunit